MSEKQYKSPLVSCICCREVKSAQGIFGHFFAAHTEEGRNHAKTVLDKGRQTKASRPKLPSQQEIDYCADPKKCIECESVLPYEKRINQFCSKSCRAVNQNRLRIETGWTRSAESKARTSETLKSKKSKKTECRLIPTECSACSKFFFNRVGWKYRKTCGLPTCFSSKTRTCAECGTTETTKGTFLSDKCSFCSDSLVYRRQCEFKFNLKDYPNEFDFQLLTEHGMFSPKKNPKGVSRDHMLSVQYGKENRIDPKNHSTSR